MAALYAGMSYEEVVCAYSSTITGVCLMRLQNYTDAEDCFQNTFVRLLTKSPSFSDENHLKAWLIKVALSK